MPKVNHTQYAILGHLSSGPLSGYGIKKAIAESTQHFWSESYGNLYPTLQKLMRQKLIKQIADKQQTSKRREIKYQLTELGMKHLVAWLEQPHASAVKRDELLLKLFFGTQANKKDLLSCLESEAQKLAQEIHLLEKLKQQLTKQYAKDKDLPYWLITINCGLKTLPARLAWCQESIITLKKLEKKSC